MLGRLAGMTFVTPDLAASVEAYDRFLGFRGTVGVVDAGLALHWRAPQAAGAAQAVLWPAGGEASFIRLIESPVPASFQPLMSLGWNAAELTIRNLDDLAARLADSPFRIIGPPETLDFDFTDQIRAMQVIGPGGEVLYLTEIGADIPGFDLPRPVDEIGQIFVAVLGGADLAALDREFTALFSISAGMTFKAKSRFLAAAYGLPMETRFDLTTIALEGRTLIELDAFPAKASIRPLTQIGLPAGIAMASFISDQVTEAKTIALASGALVEILPPAHAFVPRYPNP